MQHQEKYSVTWHSYSDHLREALGEMMTSSEFADVTLVTDDKQQIRAHRNILSACSPVFKNFFQMGLERTHSVIYLRGIQYSEMESILQFIYLGNTRIYKERMNEFLMVSKNLEIKQLSMALNDQTSSDLDTNISDDEDVSKDPVKTFIKDFSNVEQQTHTSKINRNNEAEKMILLTEGNKYSCTQILDRSINRNSADNKETKDLKYICNECEKPFSGQSDLRIHILSVHEGVKYPCNQCDYQATRQDRLTRHIQSKHEGVKYTCNQCDFQSPRQESLTRHIQSIHEGVKYPCNQCDYQATQQSNLKLHIQNMHEGVKYKCDQCDYQAKRQGRLTSHIQSVHEGVKYPCNQCDYQATTQGNLTNHVQSKHEDAIYGCNQCDYEGTAQRYLKSHIKSKHEDHTSYNHMHKQEILASLNLKHVATT